jgi:hypothetical protein
MVKAKIIVKKSIRMTGKLKKQKQKKEDIRRSIQSN